MRLSKQIKGEYVEMELKYNLGFAQVEALGKSGLLDGEHAVEIESTDHFFYRGDSDPGKQFFRYREGWVWHKGRRKPLPNAELTFKKIIGDGTRTRKEFNFPVNREPYDGGHREARALAAELGYDGYVSCQKASAVYDLGEAELAIYAVYLSGERGETDRIAWCLEVELKQRKTLGHLKEWERWLAKVNLRSADREQRSLFELVLAAHKRRGTRHG